MQNEPATYTRIKASLEAAIEAFVTTGIAEIPRQMRSKGRISQVEGAQLRSILRACAKDMKRPFITAEFWAAWGHNGVQVTVKIPAKKELELITSWLRLALPPTDGLDSAQIDALPLVLEKPQGHGRCIYETIKGKRVAKEDAYGKVIILPTISTIHSFTIRDKKIYDAWIKRVRTNPEYQKVLGNG